MKFKNPFHKTNLFKYFKPHPKYAIRHKILLYLKARVDRRLGVPKDLNLSNVLFSKVCEDLKLDYHQAEQYHHSMHIKDEEHVLCQTKDGQFIIGITGHGVAACIDEYWLREGRKDLNERIYDQTKWIIPGITLLLALFSFIYTVLGISSTKSKVDQLQLEVAKMQAESHMKRDTVIKYVYPFWATDSVNPSR